ncbi:hypothetical protein Vafri_13046, partial [Volvox africanus]
ITPTKARQGLAQSSLEIELALPYFQNQYHFKTTPECTAQGYRGAAVALTPPASAHFPRCRDPPPRAHPCRALAHLLGPFLTIRKQYHQCAAASGRSQLQS